MPPHGAGAQPTFVLEGEDHSLPFSEGINSMFHGEAL